MYSCEKDRRGISLPARMLNVQRPECQRLLAPLYALSPGCANAISRKAIKLHLTHPIEVPSKESSVVSLLCLYSCDIHGI